MKPINQSIDPPCTPKLFWIIKKSTVTWNGICPFLPRFANISWEFPDLLRTRKNVKEKNFHHQIIPLQKEVFYVGNCSPLRYAIVFIAQSLRGLSVCASSWIRTRACWSKGQLCGSRRSDSGPCWVWVSVLSTASFLWPQFQFQHSFWGRSRSVCWSIKNKREHWMELRVLHNA